MTLLKPGDYILCQVSKEAISTKGPRITTEISLAGRYMVLLPFSEKVSISQKIQSKTEKNRLKKLIKSIKPSGFGVIIRTVATGKKVAELDKDLRNLYKRWQTISKKLKKATPGKKFLVKLIGPQLFLEIYLMKNLTIFMLIMSTFKVK